MNDVSSEELQASIERAMASGVALSESDQAGIVAMAAEADALSRKLARMRGADDPMRKGNAFPMGVGFTRMTRRSEKRLDASVRQAGELVAIAKRVEAIRSALAARLAGVGTESWHRSKEENKRHGQVRLVEKLLDARGGDRRIAEFTITRVNMSRDGLPVSYNFTGPGITQGINDKIDVIRVAFAGDRARLAEVVATVLGRSETKDESAGGD